MVRPNCPSLLSSWEEEEEEELEPELVPPRNEQSVRWAVLPWPSWRLWVLEAEERMEEGERGQVSHRPQMREAGLADDQSNTKKLASPGTVLTERAPSEAQCLLPVWQSGPKESW